MQKCNLCLQNKVLPMCQEGQNSPARGYFNVGLDDELKLRPDRTWGERENIKNYQPRIFTFFLIVLTQS